MKQDALQQTSKYAKAHQRKRRWYKAVSCLAAVVVFCTTYALILPAITMEQDAKCGIPEHVHDESCYIVVSEPHVHDESCYELVGGHAHTDDCYTLQRGELICGQEEREGHHHTDACYTETTTLVCGLEEDENHQHTAACYETTRELTCGLEESGGHQHTDECYAWEQVLTCGQEESEGQLVLTCNLEEGEVTTKISDTPVCGLEEHTHTNACYSDPAADVETAQIWERAIKNVELTGDWREDVIAIAKTQLGYQESAKNYIVLEDGETIKGYTRYGAWYGDPYGDWCAMFASFVLNYAEVEGIPLDANCQHWIETLSKEENDLYRPADEYLPQPGDLVFFDFDIEDEEEKDEAPTADHVGLVVEIMNDEDENPIKLKTIEGNSSDKVQYVTYELDDPAILGYGQLPEQEPEDEEPIEEPAEQFVLTAESEDGIAVTVTGDPESLPYPVEKITLSVQPVTDEDVIALWKQTVEEENLDADAGFLLELALLHDGEEIEPIGPVQVAFSGLEDQEECPAVFHLDAENESAEDMNAVLDEEGAVVLDTEHFSPYAGAPRRLSAPTGTSISGERNDTSLSEGSYYLSADAYTNNTISIYGNVTLDLNGHGFYYKGTDQLFKVQNGGSLTIIDSSSEEPTPSLASGDNYGHKATVGWDGNKPQTLEYYVTETSASRITTSESLVKYTATAKGFIVAENNGGAASVVKVESGGTFKLEGGMLTMKNSASYSGDAHIIMNEGTVNLEGGYVCGGQDTGWGGGIYSSGTINMTGGVVAANAGQSGGGICVKDGTMNMSGGVISGNWTHNASSITETQIENGAYDGGGVYVHGGTFNLSGGYITNNYKDVTWSTDRYDRHGGGGVAIDHSSTMNMTGGYVTGNQSEDAAGGIFAGYRGNSNFFRMTGGIIASNYAHYGEGGGLRVGSNTQATVDASSGGKIYITHNRTGNTKDWGGGGIFVQEGGNLSILDVLITNNRAGGLGGGVAGCPSAAVESGVSDRGAAIFDNTADVDQNHLRGEYHEKDFDRNFYFNILVARVSSQHDITKTCQDYLGTGTTAINEDMLGGGVEVWTDPNGNRYKGESYQASDWEITGDFHNGDEVTYRQVEIAALNSNATQEDREKAIEAARVFITGNYSYTNGGGIMSNGVLDMGKRDSTTEPATLTLKATKRLEDTAGNEQALTDKQFSFVLLNRKPDWDDEKGQFIYDDSMDIMGAENDKNGDIQFRDMTFIVAGTYTYYLIEQPVNDTSITQDPSVYKIVVTVTATETTGDSERTTTYNISNVEVSKDDTVIQTVIQTDSSPETTTVTILNPDDTATFVNHVVPSYSLPATGGAGTTPYTTGGLLLMVSASALLLYNHQKRRKEATASS